RGDCASFQTRACSRPPLPITRTLMLRLLEVRTWRLLYRQDFGRASRIFPPVKRTRPGNSPFPGAGSDIIASWRTFDGEKRNGRRWDGHGSACPEIRCEAGAGKRTMTVPSSLTTYRRWLHNRLPLIGSWLRRRALQGLARDGSAEAVQTL